MNDAISCLATSTCINKKFHTKSRLAEEFHPSGILFLVEGTSLPGGGFWLLACKPKSNIYFGPQGHGSAGLEGRAGPTAVRPRRAMTSCDAMRDAAASPSTATPRVVSSSRRACAERKTLCAPRKPKQRTGVAGGMFCVWESPPRACSASSLPVQSPG